MYYVLSEYGIEMEFATEVEAILWIEAQGEEGEDLWIASDEDNDYGEPADLEYGFDPYMGSYSWDC